MAKQRKLAPGGGPKRKSRKRPVGKRALKTRAAIAAAVRARKRKNPGHTRRKNQEDTGLRSAEKMFKKFHGKKSKRVDIVEQLRVTPDALADCGRLVEMVVDTGRGGKRLAWPDKSAPRVATTGDGGQLYILKGDQAIKLEGFPGVRFPKDHLDLGELVSIVYLTSKDFHDFEPSEYEHHFGLNDDTGEPRGTRPTLHYDVHSKRLYLTGGTYRTKRPGIIG